MVLRSGLCGSGTRGTGTARALLVVILLLPKQTEKCKIMKHLEVVFLAVIVVIYPFLFAVIYEMRHIRRRARGLPLFPANSLSRRLKIRILESYRYAYNQLFPG
jgi:hypothetical protein